MAEKWSCTAEPTAIAEYALCIPTPQIANATTPTSSAVVFPAGDTTHMASPTEARLVGTLAFRLRTMRIRRQTEVQYRAERGLL